jgi:hypothetical protein
VYWQHDPTSSHYGRLKNLTASRYGTLKKLAAPQCVLLQYTKNVHCSALRSSAMHTLAFSALPPLKKFLSIRTAAASCRSLFTSKGSKQWGPILCSFFVSPRRCIQPSSMRLLFSALPPLKNFHSTAAVSCRSLFASKGSKQWGPILCSFFVSCSSGDACNRALNGSQLACAASCQSLFASKGSKQWGPILCSFFGSCN